MKRIDFLRKLRALVKEHGSENIIYMDESGFQAESYRPHGWAPIGQKIYGDVSGNNRKVDNLIMAQRTDRDRTVHWLAPILFQGSCTKEWVLDWFKNHLLPVLNTVSVIVLDNARFHDMEAIRQIIEPFDHKLLPLPPYSPDFNKIENTFGTLKNRRQFLPQGSTLDAMFLSNY